MKKINLLLKKTLTSFLGRISVFICLSSTSDVLPHNEKNIYLYEHVSWCFSLCFFLALAITTAAAFLAGGPILIEAHVAFACEDLEEDALTMRICWRRMMKTMHLDMQKMGIDPG
jgi:hypothetical protein